MIRVCRRCNWQFLCPFHKKSGDFMTNKPYNFVVDPMKKSRIIEAEHFYAIINTQTRCRLVNISNSKT